MLWRKTWQLSLLICLLLCTLAQAQTKPDDCVGFWFTEEQDGVIKIYKNQAGKFEGRIVWIRDLHTGKVKEILDVNNKDKSRHQKPILNMINLRDFSFNKGKEQWIDGTVYDPNNGKTYSAYLEMKKEKLQLRGFVGIPLFGRTSIWTREQGAIPEMYKKKLVPMKK